MKVNVGISNRHVHLTEEAYGCLFGDELLKKERDMKQPGEFASIHKVTIKTDKSMIENVRLMGPFRSYNQVEISKTDAFKLGINPPLRSSGDIKGSSGITLIGPKGVLVLDEGCIIAVRHIHLTPQDVANMRLDGVLKVRVSFDSKKSGIINDVYLKITEEALLEVHIDTDDANAHMINQGDEAEILFD